MLPATRRRVFPATLLVTGALAAGVLGSTIPAQASVVAPTTTVATQPAGTAAAFLWVGSSNGVISINGEDGDAINSGTLDVAGMNTGERGGAVVFQANRVAILNNSTIDASGAASAL